MSLPFMVLMPMALITRSKACPTSGKNINASASGILASCAKVEPRIIVPITCKAKKKRKKTPEKQGKKRRRRKKRIEKSGIFVMKNNVGYAAMCGQRHVPCNVPLWYTSPTTYGSGKLPLQRWTQRHLPWNLHSHRRCHRRGQQ